MKFHYNLFPHLFFQNFTFIFRLTTDNPCNARRTVNTTARYACASLTDIAFYSICMKAYNITFNTKNGIRNSSVFQIDSTKHAAAPN